MSQSLRALLVLFAVVGTLAQPALAAEGRSAYAAEVPVAGEEAAQRSEAVGRALRDVLVRVSGDPRAAGAARQVKDPGSLVAEYQYRPAEGGAGRLLRVAFDPAAVDAVLRDGGFAVKEEAPRAPDAGPRALSGSADRVRVQVRGVDSLATYARVVRQFQGLPGVERVTVRAARGDALVLDVDVRGGADELDRGVRAGETLGPDTAAAPGAWPGAVRLSYRARP